MGGVVAVLDKYRIEAIFTYSCLISGVVVVVATKGRV